MSAVGKARRLIGMRAAQIARIVRPRDVQVHETLPKMRERRVTTPFRQTRAKLDLAFAKLNRCEPLTDETPTWYDRLLRGEEKAG
jgi:predicted nuclease with RNAse H fold